MADRVSAKRRPVRAVPGASARPINDLISVVDGLAIYTAMAVALHRWLIGVSPL